MNLNDQEKLIVLFNGGDGKAFETIYDRFSSEVFNHARLFVETREEAEDIVTETFLKLWKRRGSFETMQKLRSFLYVTSKNAAIDRRRHIRMQSGKNREMILTLLKEQHETQPADSVTGPVLNRIYQEIEKLPGKSREVFKLAYLDELKNAEIAARLGTNEKTVRNQKASALKRLRMSIVNRLGS